MSLNELQHLIADGEHDTLEFKQSTGQRSRAMEALCAMLNHCGGRVVFIPDPNGLIHRSPGQRVHGPDMVAAAEPNGVIHRSPGQRPGNADAPPQLHAEGVLHRTTTE